jgi:hypothetical protein
MPGERESPDVPPPADFSDPESQRVLDATARALARELGAQAYRELAARKLPAGEKQPVTLSVQCSSEQDQQELAERLQAEDAGRTVTVLVRQ